jgi:hypothetical protein
MSTETSFARRSSNHLSSLLFLGGIAPFVLARFLPVHSSWCPTKALTGIPCATCGATRAFVLASRGDRRFLRFNAVWVVAAVASTVAGIVLRALPATERRVVRDIEEHPARAKAAFGFLLAAGWINAVARRL